MLMSKKLIYWINLAYKQLKQPSRTVTKANLAAFFALYLCAINVTVMSKKLIRM